MNLTSPITRRLTGPLTQGLTALQGASGPGIRLSANSLMENSANGTQVGVLSVSGGTGTYTFTLTDTAGSRFKVAGTNGVNLQAGATASDREAASSYNVTVHADNGLGGALATFDRTFSIAIGDANEATPVITSNGGGSTAAISIAENTTAVTTVTATDADATANITYSITGGADAAKFSIDATTGALRFITAPDFETPTDADANNAYIVIVTASDGTNVDTQTITVNVTDVAEGGGAVTSMGLTPIPDQRLYQRSAGATTAPVPLAGTFAGGTLSGVQAQVLRVSDNGVVLDWTTLTSPTIGASTWSGTLAGVPQGGGAYYVKVRASNATGVGATGATGFYVGIMVAGYGQSNMNGLFNNTEATPPAAAAGTVFFNSTDWLTAPIGSGIRELLNAVRSASGVAVGALNGAVNGTPLTALMKGFGSGYYEAWAAQIAAVGGVEFVVYLQGEGDALGAGAGIASWNTDIATLHGSVASDTGRTKAQLPFLVAGLGSFIDDTLDGSQWDQIQNKIFVAGTTNPSMIYSHSNIDAILGGDNLHFTTPSEAKAGKRYARAITTSLGLTTGLARMAIASSSVISATVTRVVLAHGLGTDFTPTTGIKGFDVSGDNGSSWVAATGARVNATTIDLTHASLVTTSSRKLRLYYGSHADVTSPAIDNSGYAVTITPSGGALSPTPLAVLPVPTFRTREKTAGGASPLSGSSFSIGPAAPRRMVILCIRDNEGSSNELSAMSCVPNVGTAKAMTRIAYQFYHDAVAASMWTCVLDADADTATTAVIRRDVGNSDGMQYSVSTVPSGDLLSTTPTDVKNVISTGSVSSLSTTLNVSAGGFLIANTIMYPDNFEDTRFLFTGAGTFGVDFNDSYGGWASQASASGLSANAASSVIVSPVQRDNTSVPSPGKIVLLAAAFR